MIWTMRNRWPSGARFALNCYHHEALLVVCHMESLCHIITSRKGVTYKDTLSMLLYGFSLLPQAEAMSEADTRVLQPWYADDAAMGGTAGRNTKLRHALMGKVTYNGYFTELEKSWHIFGEGK